MPEILRLSQSVVNKIAAGEVIERPASVLKELMENALDAGAKRIDVAVEQGGLELVRVSDDGCGMRADQLPLAVATHATSKLASADDLFRVRTFGFRGEALASIAEISQFLIRSRAETETAGAEIFVDGGDGKPTAPSGCPRGTTVEVRNLFFNTPVRRKFLRSTQTELGHVLEAFTRIALPQPGVHFTIRHNQRVVHELPATENWLERIVPLLGKELADQMLWVESRDGDVRLSGYVAHPSQSRSHNRLQYLFLNGRCIRDRALQHALTEAYRGLLTVGRHPICCLKMEMPPEMVDVNVHPTKLEVRFLDGSRHYSQLLGTLRTRFLTTNLTHKLQAKADPGRAAPGFPAAEPASADDAPAAAPFPTANAYAGPTGFQNLDAQAARARAELSQWAKQQLVGDEPETDLEPAAARISPAAAIDPPGWGTPHEGLPRAPLQLHPFHPPTALRPEAGSGSSGFLRTAPVSSPAATASSLPLERPHPAESVGNAAPMDRESALAEVASAENVGKALALDPGRRGVLQLNHRYLVTIEDESVVIVDQHALHERILYQQMKRRTSGGGLERQRLLVPELIDLSAEETALLLSQQVLLEKLGFSVERFGDTTLAVSAYPAMLGRESTSELIKDLAGVLVAGGKSLDYGHLLDSLLHDMACKAAVKSGDRLSADEVDSLLEQRRDVEDSHHCPHGRPTVLVFTREQLDRQFKRT